MSESHLLRITDIENIYIVYPRLQKILDVIDEIFELSGISSEPNCLFITGHSGVGNGLLPVS